MRTDSQGRRLCTATARTGQPCRGPAITGGLVCRLHGGSAPQVREAAARITLANLVGPSLVRLGRLLVDPHTPPAVVVAAARLILDKTGYGEPLSEARRTEIVDDAIRMMFAEMSPQAFAAFEAENGTVPGFYRPTG